MLNENTLKASTQRTNTKIELRKECANDRVNETDTLTLMQHAYCTHQNPRQQQQYYASQWFRICRKDSEHIKNKVALGTVVHDSTSIAVSNNINMSSSNSNDDDDGIDDNNSQQRQQFATLRKAIKWQPPR